MGHSGIVGALLYGILPELYLLYNSF